MFQSDFGIIADYFVKRRKGDSITKITDDLVEDEIVISPIYKMVKEYPEDTEKDIYQRLN